MAEDRLALLERRIDERIADLRAQGPGEVRCGRVHKIGEIRTVRACQEVLSAEERRWVGDQRERAAEALFGVQLSGPSMVSRKHRSKGEPDHWLQLVVPAIARPLGTWQLVRAQRLNADVDRSSESVLVEEAERAPLPAPTDLLDAAEHWLLAGLAEGRTDRPLGPLRVPWEQAHVVPLGEWDRY